MNIELFTFGSKVSYDIKLKAAVVPQPGSIIRSPEDEKNPYRLFVLEVSYSADLKTAYVQCDPLMFEEIPAKKKKKKKKGKGKKK